MTADPQGQVSSSKLTMRQVGQFPLWQTSSHLCREQESSLPQGRVQKCSSWIQHSSPHLCFPQDLFF